MSPLFRSIRIALPLAALFIVLALFSAYPALAGGVVGTGTPGSCTESAFNTALTGGGSVTFNCGPNPVTITLTAIHNISASTSIDGGSKITLKAKGTNHFQIYNSYTVTLKNITLTKGKSPSVGAIENFGKLKLINVTIQKNTAQSAGGAIANYGTLSVKKSKLINNKAANGGGAILNEAGNVTISSSTLGSNTVTGGTGTGGAVQNNGGTVKITSSTISGNTAYRGGGIWTAVNSTTTVFKSTLSGNHSTTGAGIYDQGTTLNVFQSTLSANVATRDGGGVYSTGTPFLLNSTLSSNLAGSVADGGAGFIYNGAGSATLIFDTIANNNSFYGGGITGNSGNVYVQDTVVSNNGGGNCAGSLTSNGHNLSSDTQCGGVFTDSTDKNNKNAKLGALANNGGPTMTHLPQTGSPLINSGIANVNTTVDQRGITRPQGSAPDIGSVEVQ